MPKEELEVRHLSVEDLRKGLVGKSGRRIVLVVEGLTGVAKSSAPAAQAAPASMLATLEDPHFEFDKTFPLPSVIAICRDIAKAVQKDPPAHLLVVGHADKVGNAGYNKGLSKVRAQNIAAMLHDTEADVSRWLAQYHGSQFGQPWGTREDQHMLSALPHCGPKFLTAPVGNAPTADSVAALKQLQHLHGLPENGVANEKTRRALIGDYLNATAVDVPASVPLEALGAGFFHRIGPTDADDRRVDVFLFEGTLTPPAADCEGAKAVAAGAHHCDAYDAWKKEVTGPVPHDPDDGCGGVHENGDFLLPEGSTMLCPHGGQVQATPANGRLSAGAVVLTATDSFSIAGCQFPTPCTTVTWITPALRVKRIGEPVLLTNSIGQTRDAAGQVQGIVQIVVSQTRARGN